MVRLKSFIKIELSQMPKIKKSNKLSKNSLRSAFQALIQSRIETIAAMEKLASDLNVSLSLVKKMVYKGEGGLDVWGQAFQILFKWDEGVLSDLKNDLRKKNKSSEADNIWFSIRDEMRANENDMYYLAACAKEAFRIKKEIDIVKNKKKSK